MCKGNLLVGVDMCGKLIVMFIVVFLDKANLKFELVATRVLLLMNRSCVVIREVVVRMKNSNV